MDETQRPPKHNLFKPGLASPPTPIHPKQRWTSVIVGTGSLRSYRKLETVNRCEKVKKQFKNKTSDVLMKAIAGYPQIATTALVLDIAVP